MKITKISSFTGKQNSMELDVTPEQILEYSKGEELIQNIFPNLNSGEREFIKTGVTPQEWNEVFGEE